MTPIRETIARAITDDAWDATYEMGRTSLPITGGAAHIPEAEAKRMADAVLRALDEAGLVVVPREASDAMLDAAGSAFMDAIVGHVPGDLPGANTPFRRIYRAMISAHSRPDGNGGDVSVRSLW